MITEFKIISVSAATLSLVACASPVSPSVSSYGSSISNMTICDTTQDTVIGGVGGAVIGGVVGNLIGNKTGNRMAATIGGAVLGSVAGGVYGQHIGNTRCSQQEQYTYFKQQIAYNTNAIENIKIEISQKRKQIAARNRQITTELAASREAEIRAAKSQSLIAEIDQDLAEIYRQQESVKNDIRKLDEQIQELKRRGAGYQNQITELTNQKEKLKSILRDLNQDQQNLVSQKNKVVRQGNV